MNNQYICGGYYWTQVDDVIFVRFLTKRSDNKNVRKFQY
ncbi:hypothetical protein ACQ27_gp260 [Klebsiella phage K64-1]|nr:hypothetical protein ACQ27_gp260 [Klebsiella phage K64-1]